MGKPDVRHLRGGAGNVAYGGTVNPPRYRKGGAGNPPPTGARASALPDGARVPVDMRITIAFNCIDIQNTGVSAYHLDSCRALEGR